MPEKPVAILRLDTRAHGPYFCEKCDAENEDALLMTDASIVCPECREPMPEFQEVTDCLVSAGPAKETKTKSGRKSDAWVIEWSGPDTSRDDATVAYASREEALESAADWAKQQANDQLEQFEWDEDDQQPKDIKEILEAAKRGDHLETVRLWLDFQSEYDPDEKMSIGPSGYVSARSSELS